MRVATLLVVLVACAPPPAKQFEIVRPLMLQRCVPQFTASSRTGLDVLVVDEPVELTFAGSARLDCEFGIREAESISAELIDDSSAPVEVQTKVERSGSNWSVKVSVTPRHEGPLHLRLVAEPSIGVFTQALRVVRLSPRTWERLAGRFCDGLIDVPFGAPLCVSGIRLEFAGRSVPANGVAVSDSMLWVSTPQGVDGWRVDGGEAFKAVSVPLQVTALAARGRRFCAASWTGVTVIDEDGGLGLISFGAETSVIHGLGFEDDDTLVVARGERLDRVHLSAVGQTVSLPPQLDQPRFVRLGSEGLWSLDSRVLRLRRFDGGVARTSGGDEPPHGPSIAPPDLVPLLLPGQTDRLFGVPILTPDGGIAVDFVELPANAFATWLTSRWFFARDSSNGELWRAPRTP